MPARVGLLGALLLILLPGAAVAQGRSCRQVLPADARRLMNVRGQEMVYFQDPVRVLCTGGIRLEADSAVLNRAAGTVQVVGSVVYRDSLRQLTADWANYIGERDQLLARGNVVLRNLADGAVVEGDELDYLRSSPSRPVSRMIVRGERPYAVIPPRPDSGGVDAPRPGLGGVDRLRPGVGAADTLRPGVGAVDTLRTDTASVTEVWADRMEFEGEEVFRGLGNVELRRGEMTGAGDTAVFDQTAEQMTLTGGAHVQTEQYRLEGEQIDAFLAGRDLRTVTADRSARVESEELTVDSDRIRIGFEQGRLDRLEAWNPVPDSAARALADARDFRLRADSIDAHADSLGIREIRAVGRAYGERDPDTVATALSGAVARDWIQGDTIYGFFEHRRPQRAAPMPAAGGGLGGEGAGLRDERTRMAAGLDDPSTAQEDSLETVLERIVVIGREADPALSLYRLQGESGDGPSINFMKAERITLFMDQGEVARVEAEGPLDGLYLAPAPPEEPEAVEEGGEEAGEWGQPVGQPVEAGRRR